MAETPDRTYHFKHYRRTGGRGSTSGELLKQIEIPAKGLAYAAQIAEQDYMDAVDFDYDFVILEGNEFIQCYFEREVDA